MSSNDTFLAVFLGSKSSPKMAAWSALPEAERKSREQQGMAAQARAIFARSLSHCRQITSKEWRESRTIWRRLKQRWAYWLLVRIDPYLARRQWQALPD